MGRMPLYLQTLDGETTRWRDEVGTAEDRRGSKEIAHNAVPGGPEPHANGNQPAYACARGYEPTTVEAWQKGHESE